LPKTWSGSASVAHDVAKPTLNDREAGGIVVGRQGGRLHISISLSLSSRLPLYNMAFFLTKHENQPCKQRGDFKLAVKMAGCPKDGSRMLEVRMPEVVCKNCGTHFILAIQPGSLFMRSRLVETAQATSPTDAIAANQSSWDSENKRCQSVEQKVLPHSTQAVANTKATARKMSEQSHRPGRGCALAIGV
jgi:hypothetical protein